MTRFAFLFAFLCFGVAAWGDASFTRTSEVKLGGALGTAVSMMAKLGGAPSETVERVFVQGDKMRTDEGETSTIMDIGARRTLILHHEDKTYTELPFDMYRSMMKSGLQARPQVQGSAQQQYAAQDEGTEVEVEVDFDVEVVPTGKKKKLKGHEKKASEVLSTVTVDFKGEAQAAEAQGDTTAAQEFEGQIVVASQLWMMKKIKGYDQVEAFQRKLGEAFLGERQISQGQAMAMRDAFLSDPRIGEGLKKAAAEQQKIEGFEAASTMHVVLVPGELEYDADKVWAKKKKKGGFGGFAAGLAKQAALAKAGAGAEEGEAPPPEQTTLVTVKKKLSKASTKKLDPALFAVPKGYSKREWPAGMGMGEAE